MLKKIMLLSLLPFCLLAKLEVAETKVVLEADIMNKIENTSQLILKVYDADGADDEKGLYLDELYRHDKSVTLYKVNYNQLGGSTKWRKNLVGAQDFADLETVYIVYKDGKEQKRLHPDNFSTKNTRLFKKYVTEAFSNKVVSAQ